MQAQEIRKAFLDFFQDKGHLVMPSSSLIPAGDPTLLLTSAGMVQLKPYFTGEMKPPQPRLTTVQKCFRVSDVDEVGDTSHLTFFEMLGNFSIGDYFKEEAIAWAWEFVTQHMKLPPERLWATVFTDDDEAYHLWQETGVPAERIRRFGEEDNYWGPAGNEGPCGPCSEIHYDFGGACRMGNAEEECGPNCECGRFLELWNLVFMQFYQDPEGQRTPLPRPNIDTGMGLERAAMILQDVQSIYDTDLFAPIVKRVVELAGKPYGKDEETDVAIRVVAEHARSAAFLIADGVVPDNKGRGYVLRRLIRRAIRFGRKLGLESVEGLGLATTDDGPDSVRGEPVEPQAEPRPSTSSGRTVLPEVAEVVIQHMGGAYPELASGREFVLRVLQLEEERFGRTLTLGAPVLDFFLAIHKDYVSLLGDRLGSAKGPGVTEAAIRVDDLTGGSPELGGAKSVIDRVVGAANQKLKAEGLEAVHIMLSRLIGAETFLLHDTYGFPPELTDEVAKEHGLDGIDWQDFEKEMEAQQERSRAASGFAGDANALRVYQEMGVGGTRFLGYETTAAPSVIVGLLVDGATVNQAAKGQQVEVILRETPFYAEGGGQVGDTGMIEGPQGEIQVEDTQSPLAGLTVHRCRVVKGTVALGETVAATVEGRPRMDAARNHTATHLLHAALRQVLGTHVRQQGSMVAPDRLRFDFTHVSGVSQEELRTVEELVNDRIRTNVPVQKRETTYRQAVAEGALAFFGDRYGDEVRVVEIASNPSLEVPPKGEPARSAGGVGQPFSFEVCGGTHVQATGDIGYCHITGESSIGAGLRRIEAVTGRAAEALVRDQEALLSRVARQLEASPQDLEAKVASLVQEAARLRRETSAQERASSRQQAQELLEQAQEMNGLKVASGTAQVGAVEALREMGDWLRDKLGSGVVVLGAVVRERPTLLVMVTPDLVSKGLHAGNAVKEAAKVMGGGGGGRPEMAQAGGRQVDKLEEAVDTAVEVVSQQWAGGDTR